LAAPFAAGTLAGLIGAARGDGFERCLHLGAAEAVWAVLLSGPAAFIVYALTTSRAAVNAQAAAPSLISLAHRQGATSVTSWVASNNLGQAILLITVVSVATTAVFLMARFGSLSPEPVLLPAPGQDEGCCSSGSGPSPNAGDCSASGELSVPFFPSLGPASGSAP
jgi:hypothetical protein